MTFFNGAHINIRSLVHNFDTFKDHVLSNDYSVIGISETWLTPNINNEIIDVPGYNFVRQDRHSRGGGVGLYIKNQFIYDILRGESVDVVEHLWVKLECGAKTLIIGTVYRPPNANNNEFISYLEDMLIDFFTQNSEIICFGDININLIDNDSSQTIQFQNVIKTFNLEQIISVPTRISCTSSTLIDVICCNTEYVQDSGVKDISVSDHFLVYVVLKYIERKPSQTPIKYRNFKNMNLTNFQSDLESAPWDLIFGMDDIDEKVTFLTDLILRLFDCHAPMKLIKCKRYAYSPWITDNVKYMKTLKNQALNRYRRTKNPEHWNYYKQMRNLTTSAIRSEKKAYLNYKFQTSTAKEQWNELRRLNILSNKTSNIPENLQNVNEINGYFTQTTKTCNIPKKDILDYYNNNSLLPQNSFSFSTVSEDLISHIILAIRSKAFGSDDLNISLISFCCLHIVPYITDIINSCIQRSYFPKSWKLANVTPLPKKSNPTEFSHLRSISILPTLSKILEKVMETQIRSYLSVTSILPIKQSGFRAGYSCGSALTDVVDDVVRAQDKNNATVLVLLDYSKAFDVLNHILLILILKYIGFTVEASSFIKSFLTDRCQRVVWENNYSEILSVSSGVPQGSILGPLLFSIYTSNFVGSLKYSGYHLYADDTQIYISFNQNQADAAHRKLNSDLDRILKVSSDHMLDLNPSKSTALLFCAESYRDMIMEHVRPRLGDNLILFQKSCKNLGLVMDNKLKFNGHITLCLARAFSKLKLIYSQRHFLSQKTKTILCDTLVLSHFNYLDNVYGPFLDSKDNNRVQKIQNSCVRLICGIRRRQRVSHKLRELNWLNMSERRLLHSVCFFYKILKHKCPPYLYNKLQFRTDVHNLNIRRQHLLTIPAHKKEFFKKSFSYQIATSINKFTITDFSRSVLSFKRKIKNQLLPE